jgi:rare lipoprotein A (peptidoglycan hydrolase)
MTRAKRKMRAPHAAMLVAGALLMILPATLLTLAGGSADAASVTRSAHVSRKHAHHHRHHGHHRRRHHVMRAVEMTPVVASWYYDEGDTACGFHAEYGVANKTLPCGTRVTLNYAGHTVVATVDDRGPFIYGRSFDLDQKTAQALGMWGVATVYSHID